MHSFGYNSSGYSSFVVVPTELTDYTEAYGFIFLESTERIDAARHTTDGTEMIVCVAEGGESCLTSGDRREPEDKYVYIKTSSPSLGKAERGGRGKMWWGRYSSGSFQSPEVKHNSPPSATSERSPLMSITR